MAGKEALENMCFCETNRIPGAALFYVTVVVTDSYRSILENTNPVRLENEPDWGRQ